MSRRLQLIILGLGILGAAVSSYLAYYYLTDTPVPCSASIWHGGCQIVQASSYARPWGIPLPVAGLAFYLALIVLMVHRPTASRALRSGILFVLAAVGFGFSLYLTALEAFVIKAWCAWCVASALVATALFVITLVSFVRIRRRAIS